MNEESMASGSSYTGHVACAEMNGEATLSIETDSLTISSLFSDISVGYEEISAIRFQDYMVEVKTGWDTFCFSRMGQQCEWFYNELSRTYNGAVLSALLVKSDCLFETRGRIFYESGSAGGAGIGNTGMSVAALAGCESISAEGTIRVFEDCVCLLPPGREARRLPFVFFSGMKNENYSLSLTLSTGESCVLSMLGRDLDPLEKCITERILDLRKRSGELISHLCDTLSPSQVTRGANLLRPKIALPQNALLSLPALSQAVLAKVKNSGMHKSWEAMAQLGDAQKLCVGIWELPEEEVERLKQQLLEKMNEAAQGDEGGGAGVSELTQEQEDALRWMLWAAVPSVDGRTAVVEFAFPNEATATYIYRVDDPWNAFLANLNRAMEAVDFNREVIMLGDEQLADGMHREAQMLVIRTPALARLRRQYAGRVIHKSFESWRKGVEKYMQAGDL